jgi:pimeloyl-ACP methyl ester carboxylesterase
LQNFRFFPLLYYKSLESLSLLACFQEVPELLDNAHYKDKHGIYAYIKCCIFPLSAFLHRGDYNFIAVDWQKLAAGPWYLSASNNAVPVGKALAKLIDRLIAIKAIRLDTLHLIGFSLGAHVSGVAARNLKSGRVPRITGIETVGEM